LLFQQSTVIFALGIRFGRGRQVVREGEPATRLSASSKSSCATMPEFS